MNKKELIVLISNKTGKQHTECETILNATLEAISETIAKGEKVQLVGFGYFKTQSRSERLGRNPHTGDVIHIAPYKKPVFKAGKYLTDLVNNY